MQTARLRGKLMLVAACVAVMAIAQTSVVEQPASSKATKRSHSSSEPAQRSPHAADATPGSSPLASANPTIPISDASTRKEVVLRPVAPPATAATAEGKRPLATPWTDPRAAGSPEPIPQPLDRPVVRIGPAEGPNDPESSNADGAGSGRPPKDEDSPQVGGRAPRDTQAPDSAKPDVHEQR